MPLSHRCLHDKRRKRPDDPTLAPEETSAILKARALVLAEVPPVEKDSADLEVLEFRLAGESYAIKSQFVKEVYPLSEYTPIPGTPDFIMGIMSVRGQILSIMDLGRFFKLPAQGNAAPTRVLIAQAGEMEVALPVDEIEGVRPLPLEDIQNVLPTLTGGAAAYLQGVTRGRLILLDIAKLLSNSKIIVNEERQ